MHIVWDIYVVKLDIPLSFLRWIPDVCDRLPAAESALLRFGNASLFWRGRLIKIHYFISDAHGVVCPWAYETFHWTTFIAYGAPSSNIICNDIIESPETNTGWGKSRRGKTKDVKASYVADIYETLCGERNMWVMKCTDEETLQGIQNLPSQLPLLTFPWLARSTMGPSGPSAYEHELRQWWKITE